jgi:hypothetical protein
MLDVEVRLNGQREQAVVFVYFADADDVDGVGGECLGTIRYDQFPDSNRVFSVPVAPGTYCVKADPNHDDVFTVVTTVQIAPRDPPADSDAVINES